MDNPDFNVMPISRFFVENGATPEQASAFASDFYQAPGANHYPASSHARAYQDATPAVTSAVSILFQYTFRFLDPILLQHESKALQVMSIRAYKNAFGTTLGETEEDAKKSFCFTHAASYHFTGHGTCSYRACYAALRLKQLFKETVAVAVQSSPTKDHFVLSLRGRDNRWLVLDPLTNSDLLFESAYYNREVLPTFPSVTSRAAAYSYKITNEISTAYFDRWKPIQELLLTLCETAPKDVADVRNHIGLFTAIDKALVAAKSPRDAKSFDLTSAKALQTFHEIIERNRPDRNIPTFSASFIVTPTQPTESAELCLSGIRLQPSSAKFDPNFVHFIEGFIRDFLWDLKDNPRDFELELAFTATHNIELLSASPKGIADAWSKHVSDYVVEVDDNGTRTVTSAIPLILSNLTLPARLNIKIDVIFPSNQIGGLTTGGLRYPHLLIDLSKRFHKEIGKGGQTRACIVGPGLLHDSCPQYVELLGLFPRASFALLDNNTDLLKTLKCQFEERRAAKFDPTAFQKRLMKSSSHRATGDLLPVLELLCESLAGKTAQPDVSRKVLSGELAMRELEVTLDPKRTKVGKFDILSSSFTQPFIGVFDIIVATMSISNAITSDAGTDATKDYFAVVEKFLQPLKVGGVLYTDAHLWDGVLAGLYGEEDLRERLDKLGASVGIKVKLERLPLSLFDPSVKDTIAHVPSPTMVDERAGRMAALASHELLAITRIE